ncbi:pyrimidine utilization protein D [Sphingomonas sp. ERG5]|uniref:pyrimidine utilization protein D n=1 Tax=Sphingomonas sp. ERG5 TaxID=1381597 RepID=UPI00054B9F9B|nr:pyrimidine utilization protein D [Sphingomonas sp. ERG5]
MPEAAGLYYETHGAAGAPPLILSSGMGGSASYWRPNVAALAGHFHVIAYDHRGTGRSDRTVTPRIDSIGDDMLALMDALNLPRASIVGHAIGGMGGLTLALDTPARVDRLVVVNGWGRPDPYTARCFDARLNLLRHGGVRDYVHAQPIFLYPPQWISDHDRELAEEEGMHIAAFPADMVEQRILEAVDFDVMDRLAGLAVPTLLLTSDDDGLVPPGCSGLLAGAIPGARLETMKWGGHACNVTDPDTFNALILDFLRS